MLASRPSTVDAPRLRGHLPVRTSLECLCGDAHAAWFLIAGLLIAHQEPEPRSLKGTRIHIAEPIAHISSARELRDGRVLLTNAQKPAGVYLLDPASGAAIRIGGIGADQGQYVQPGGIYTGSSDSLLIVDRALTRVVAVSPLGVLGAARSIAVRGTSGSWDADIDQQRVDARGFTYFAQRPNMRPGASIVDSAALVRFEPVSQRGDTVAWLRQREMRVVQVDEHRSFGRAVIESPADGWGVTADGRVAVVRASPYRVDWYAPNGRVTRGPVASTEPIPITDAEKKAFIAANSGLGVSAGPANEPKLNNADLGTIFAPVKAAFPSDSIVVSSSGRVFVMRSRPAGETGVLYDVFDDTGKRIDRIGLPPRSRIIGFGPSSIYVTEGEPKAPPALKKYKL